MESSSYRKKCLRPFVHGCHGNAEIHVYQVSPPCIVWCASLRSEEVVIGKSARGNFLSVVVMETLKNTCKKFHFHALYGVQV